MEASLKYFNMIYNGIIIAIGTVVLVPFAIAGYLYFHFKAAFYLGMKFAKDYNE